MSREAKIFLLAKLKFELLRIGGSLTEYERPATQECLPYCSGEEVQCHSGMDVPSATNDTGYRPTPILNRGESTARPRLGESTHSKCWISQLLFIISLNNLSLSIILNIPEISEASKLQNHSLLVLR